MEEAGIHVLHVDDEPDFTRLVADMLEREDDRFTVETATSANDGLVHLSDTEYDCIVSDYDMPGQNGIEFLETVREDYPDLPFLLYTGKGSEAVASEAISAGVTDYLQKGGGTEQYELLANRVCNAVEQYRSKQEAKRTRRRLRNLAESTSQCVWMFDRDWEELFFISGYEAVWNRPTEAIRENPKEFLDNVHPKDREFVRNAMERMSNGEPIDIEYRILRGDDESGWVWVEGEPVFDGDEAVKSVVGFTRDITDRKQREQRLERHERIVENLPVGVFRTTPDGEYIDTNEQYRSLLGVESKAALVDFQAQTFWADPNDRETLLRQLEREGAVDDREVEIETFGGDSRWLETTLQITDKNGDRYLDGIARDVTEQRERRRRLEQAETLFENAQDGLFLIDVSEELTIEQVNPAYEEATGLSKDTLAGRTPREIFGDDQGAEIEQKYRECVDRRSTLEYRKELSIDGTQTYWETRIAPVVIGGEIRKIVGATRNITEREQHRRALERYQKIVETMDDVAFIVDGTRTVEFVNKSILEYVDVPRDALEGQPIMRLAERYVPEDDGPERFEQALERTFQRESEAEPPERLELTLDTDGETPTFEYQFSPLISDGETTAAVITMRDTTERNSHERRLRALNRATRELLTADTREEVAEMGIEVARDVLDLEASSVHLYDEEASGLVPVAVTDPVYDLIDEAPTFTGKDSVAWRVYQQGEPLMLNDVREDPDIYNPETPARSELYLPLGEYGLLIATSEEQEEFDERDVTMGDILAANITTALLQVERREQLQTRERELIRQNERLEEFASVISHDLRNPLNVAEGSLELAQEDCKSDHLATVVRAHDRMGSLIDDLLTLARQGETVTDTEPVDLTAIAEECWENVKTADASLETESCRPIEADESRFKQVSENLIRNAVEHGGEDVTVTVGELADGFYIEDDGSGIAEDDREEVFTAGYSSSERGTGFGLSIVEEIAEAHDWEIRVTEGSDGGARFEITGVKCAAE